MAKLSVNCKNARICNAAGVFLVQTEATVPGWCFILVNEAKLPVFKGLINFFPLKLNLSDYGKILKSGHGENPPDNIRTQIKNGDFSKENSIKESQVFCILSEDENKREFYNYVDVPYYLVNKFMARTDQEKKFELTEYGEILYSDWGRPTEEVTAMMNEKYGISTPVFESMGAAGYK